MPIGLALGLLASLTWGIGEVAGAISTRMIGSLRVLVWAQAVSIVTLVVIVLVRPDLLGPTALAGIVAAFPFGLMASLVYLAYYTSLRIGPVSIVSPVIVAYGGATVVLAVLFRGESLTLAQAGGAAVATAGVVLAAISFEGAPGGRKRGLSISVVGPGVAVALFTMAGFAIVTVLLAGPVGTYGWLPAAIGSRLGNNVASMLLLVVALRTGSPRFRPLLLPWHGWSRRSVLLALAAGAFDTIGFVGFVIGLGLAPAWLLGLSSSFGPVLAVVWAVASLGERPRLSQWMGLVAIGAGVVVLAVAG